MIPLYVGNHTFHVDFTIKPRINNYETVKEFVTGPQPIIKLDSLVAHNEGINIIGTKLIKSCIFATKKIDSLTESGAINKRISKSLNEFPVNQNRDLKDIKKAAPLFI